MKLVNFADMYAERKTRKGHFLNQMDVLVNWEALAKTISRYYKPASTDATGRPAYPGILLFKRLLVGIWHGGMSDENVEDMANSNLHVLRFLKLSMEDEVPDHSVLSRFRTCLTKAEAWDALLAEVNAQITGQGLMVTKGYHVDASLTQSQRKPKARPTYEVKEDRCVEEDECTAKGAMRVIKIKERGVDEEARWTKGKFSFGYKQHTLVNDDGLVQAIETTPANCHDSKPFLALLNKAPINKGARIHADKAYPSAAHTKALKEKGFKNGIQRKALKNRPLTKWERTRNKLITQVRYVVERTFGSQKSWFGSGTVRYVGLAKAHAWHTLQGIAYNLKRLPVLYAKRLFQGVGASV